MTIHFGYEKKQVIQALRYHFLNRPEIKILLIFVNVFAITSAVLFYFSIIQALSFLVFSTLWFLLLLIIWRILPLSIYRRSATFRDHFALHFRDNELVLETERGVKGWPWKSFSHFIETPYFFHLYFDARSFFLVPKDSFEDLAGMQEARRIFREKINRH